MNRLGYLIKSGFTGIFSHGLMSFATVTIIMACLIIMGSFGLLVVNINEMLAGLEDENEVVAFVDDALTLEEIERRGAENCLLSVDALFAGRPIVLLKDARAEKALRNGMDVKFDAGFEGECRVYAENGEFLALCRAEGGILKTIKSFFEV